MHLFDNIGSYIVKHYKKILLLTVIWILSGIPSFISLKFIEDQSVEEVMIARRSQSDKEYSRVKEMWNYPFRYGVVVLKHEENIITKPVLSSMYKIINDVKLIQTISGMLYQDLCHKEDINGTAQCQLLSLDFWGNSTNMMDDNDILATINDKCEPIYDRHRKLLNDITYDQTGKDIIKAKSFIISFRLSNLHQMKNEVDEWEILFSKYIRSNIVNLNLDNVSIYYSFYGGMNQESNKASSMSNTDTSLLIIIQYLIMWLYLGFMISPNVRKGETRFLLAASGLCLGIMAFFWTVAICFSAGITIEKTVVISIFSILAISVDDVFVFMHSYESKDKKMSIYERVHLSVREVGPSITISSLTTSASLLLGIALTSRPLVRNFAIILGIAFVIDYILQLFVFPCMVIILENTDENDDEQIESIKHVSLPPVVELSKCSLNIDKLDTSSTMNDASSIIISPLASTRSIDSLASLSNIEFTEIENKWLATYVELIKNRSFRWIMMLCVFAPLIFVTGFLLSTTSLSTSASSSFPPSDLTNFYEIVKESKGPGDELLINLKPTIDYSTMKTHNHMDELQRTLYHHSDIIPPIYSWHRDYHKWLESMVYYQKKPYIPLNNRKVYEKWLREFLAGPGVLYNDDIQFCADNETICNTRIRVNHRHCNNANEEMTVLHNIRWTLASDPYLDATLFSESNLFGAIFIDGVNDELYTQVIFTFILASLVFFGFSRNVLAASVTSLCGMIAISTSIAFSYNITPITAFSPNSALMGVGIVMDISTHLAAAYVRYAGLEHEERVIYALQSYAWAGLQSCSSTVLGVTALAFSVNPVLKSFWILFTFTAIMGAIAGLFIQPIILLVIWPSVSSYLSPKSWMVTVQALYRSLFVRFILIALSTLLLLQMGYTHMFTRGNVWPNSVSIGPAQIKQRKAPQVLTEDTVVKETFDFIVVGTGTAGSIIASKLGDSNQFTTLALDKGPMLTDNSLDGGMFIKPTAPFYEFLFNSPHDPRIFSVPQESVSYRKLIVPRFVGFGGTSMLNGGLSNRPSKECINKFWPDNWKYDDMLPYFKLLEDHYCYYDNHTSSPTNFISPTDCSKYHGKNGMMEINTVNTDAVLDWVNPKLNNTIWNACDELNMTRRADYTGSLHEGCAWWQFFRSRVDLDHDFLAPDECEIRRKARIKPNAPLARGDTFTQSILKDGARTLRRGRLTLRSSAKVNNILFDGTRAIGVSYRIEGRAYKAYARREVIISGGAFGTPVLLQVSGIGSQIDIERLGVSTIANNPFVGKKLQDHIQLAMEFEAQNVTFPLSNRQIFEKTIKEKPGYFQINGHFSFTVHKNSGLKYNFEDYQLYLVEGLPAKQSLSAISTDGVGQFGVRDRHDLVNVGNGNHALPTFFDEKKEYFSFAISHKFPDARGYVLASTKDVDSPPILDLGFNDFTDYDRGVLKDAIVTINKLMNTTWGRTYAKKATFPDPKDNLSEDEHIRLHSASTYQVMGSCQMGLCTTSDGLKVRGVSNLRVCDASVLPGANSNIEGPILAVCLKFVDELIEEHRSKLTLCNVGDQKCYDDPAPYLSGVTVSGTIINLVSARPHVNIQICYTTNVTHLTLPQLSEDEQYSQCTATNWHGDWTLPGIPENKDIIIYTRSSKILQKAWIGSTNVPYYTMLPTDQFVSTKQWKNIVKELNNTYDMINRGGISWYALTSLVMERDVYENYLLDNVEFYIVTNDNRTLLWIDSENYKFHSGESWPAANISRYASLDLNIKPGRYETYAMSPSSGLCVPTLDSHIVSHNSSRAWVTIWPGTLSNVHFSCVN